LRRHDAISIDQETVRNYHGCRRAGSIAASPGTRCVPARPHQKRANPSPSDSAPRKSALCTMRVRMR
jgi:hypothetical protein